MYRKWHIPDIKALEKEFDTDLVEGLTIREARARLEKEKRRSGTKRKSLFVPRKTAGPMSFLSFFKTPGVILLLLISLLSLLFGSTLTGASVLMITLAGAAVGGFISYRSEKKLDMMRDYASPMLRIKRGGNVFYTDGRNAVVGDIIILSRGDLLTCDARLISSEDLEVKELIPTKNGIRNRVISKDHGAVYSEEDKLAVYDAANMLYAGTAVMSGKGMAVVTSTGADVFLSDHLPDGALAQTEGEGENKTVEPYRQTIYKISFICGAILLILSLLSLITLRDRQFINNFLMLLSSVAFISAELIGVGSKDIIARYIMRMNKVSKSVKKRETSASVRNIKALGALTEITDLVLLGKAGLCSGTYRIGETYTAKGMLSELTPDSKAANRLLTYVFTYIKALRDNKVENSFVQSGVCDSLSLYLRSCGFDLSGASLVIKSLYYANDPSGDSGYACAETTENTYRTALTFDREILSFCKSIRDGSSIRPIERSDIENIEIFVKKCDISGAKTMFVVTDTVGESVLEGIISLKQDPVKELEKIIPQLNRMGIHTTVMLSSESKDALSLINDPLLSPLFEGNTVFADDVYKQGKTAEDIFEIGYSAYVGFSVEEYASLILKMRKSGRRVAAYGIDNEYYPVMSASDVSVSCDVMRYSSDKYKDSVYEKMVPEGRDTNLRCSQMTRLLSRVTVRRSHERGGGAESILQAIKMSRGAYISLSQSILLFTMLMSSLLPIVIMSVCTGNLLLNAVQASALATSAVFLGILAFSDCEQKNELLYENRNYHSYPIDTLKYKLPQIIARASVAFISAVTIKILDLAGVFGERASYTMPIYISLLLTAFAELFIINGDYTKRGEGRRRCWLKMLFVYALMLALCGIFTQRPFTTELFPDGIGSTEFFIVPAYLLMYTIAVFSARFIEKRRKLK